MKVSDWRIGYRLMAGFAVLLLLIIGIGVISLISLSNIRQRADEIVTVTYPTTAGSHAVANQLDVNSLAVEQMLLTNKPEQIKEAADIVINSAPRISKIFEMLEQSNTDPKSVALFNEIKRLRGGFAPSINRTVALMQDGKREEATDLFVNDTLKQLVGYKAAIDAYIANRDEHMRGSQAVINATYAELVWVTGGLIVASLALGALLAWYLTRSVSRPLAQVLAAVEKAGRGDLTLSRREAYSKDETGRLMAGLDNTTANLHRLVSQIRDAAGAIAGASSQIAAGNQDLSSRTEEQAGSLEETASAMEELASTINNTAENTRHALDLVTRGGGIIQQNGDLMRSATQQMQGISQSSEKVAEIIGVIESIAFQTNILALNAAVEAARAGEQGRGFAVVAAEVRSLAQKSATAAKEIKDLIDTSVNQVREGRAMVEKADAMTQEMVGNAGNIHQIINEISQASQEQSDGVGQVNQAIGQIDTATQQNAALVEEAASAATEMHHQSEMLTKLVGTFKLGDEAPALAPAPARAEPKAAASLPAPVSAAPAARKKPVVPTSAKPARLSARSRQEVATATDAGGDDWTSF